MHLSQYFKNISGSSAQKQQFSKYFLHRNCSFKTKFSMANLIATVMKSNRDENKNQQYTN